MNNYSLFLIRHALPSDAYYDNRPPGPGLGATGQMQAEWLGNQLKAEGIYQLFVSDFRRTLETAGIISQLVGGLPIHADIRLRERQAEEESHESLVARVGDWWQETLPHLRLANSAVVAHGGSLNMLLAQLDADFQRFHYPYCDPYLVRTPIAGYWKISLKPLSAQLFPCPI